MTAVFTRGAEMSSAVTDLMICLCALIYLPRGARMDCPRQRRRLFLCLLWLLVLNSLAGALVHGLAFFCKTPSIYYAAWTVMNVLLMSLGVPLASAMLAELLSESAVRWVFAALSAIWAVLSVIHFTGVFVRFGLVPVYVFMGGCLGLSLVGSLGGLLRGHKPARWLLAATLAGIGGGLMLVLIPDGHIMHVLVDFDNGLLSHLFFLFFPPLFYRGHIGSGSSTQRISQP